ncbi:threonine/homoserine/homoserine lactone efflux protein [Novosphingobium capsulatum]|uniref:Threonine/homoserine/homoserine lactone efflux protein n=1 Tax=Novosphingobium capsulatum TaxID=13688 RepID=A0ABU1MHB6_9SPHN|nr:LysE family translocator [Novosphingobium capsulatum]MDR6509711.1 threonine/homoserine/homoserine lactone efflux protein [Novosphingobium capsulatum]
MALHTWWLFVVTVFFISISPVPNMLHVMTRSVTLGFGRAMLAMSGCFLAVLTLLSLSAAGLSAVLVAMPQVFTALKIVGAAYLLYLGYKSWTAKESPVDMVGDGAVALPSLLGLFRTGFLIGISNPKALLFAGAFLPQFIDPARPKAAQFAVMVATFGVIEMTSYLLYALGGRSVARWLEKPSPRKVFNRVTGAIFVAFGVAMVGSRV